MGRLLRLHAAYEGRAAFLLVVITDAGHPEPGGPTGAEGPRPAGATTEERLRLAREGQEAYGVPFPVLLDEGGQAESAYAAYPQRLVVVGAGGRVVYDGGRGAAGGPSAWDLAEVEAHLRAALRPGGPAE